MYISLILTAAGTSSRMKTSQKKEFISLPSNQSILSESALAFFSYFQEQSRFKLAHCIITLPQNQIYHGMDAFFNKKTVDACLKLKVNPEFISGGKTRQESVYKGLLQLEHKTIETDLVLIHDAARPFVSKQIIHDIIERAAQYGASVPTIPSVDTQKILDSKGQFIESHLKRENIVSVQTPQAFFYDEILSAHKKAALSQKEYTDDSEIFSDFFKKPIFSVQGNVENKKITYQSDLPQKESSKNEGSLND